MLRTDGSIQPQDDLVRSLGYGPDECDIPRVFRVQKGQDVKVAVPGVPVDACRHLILRKELPHLSDEVGQTRWMNSSILNENQRLPGTFYLRDDRRRHLSDGEDVRLIFGRGCQDHPGRKTAFFHHSFVRRRHASLDLLGALPFMLEDQNRLDPLWEERAKPGIMLSAEIQDLPLENLDHARPKLP